jgi:hypothetical protein
MKTFYEQPELEVIKFDVEDVITTSGDLDEDELPGQRV